MEELLDTNGPPWWTKGVCAGGRCAPSHAEHGKLKYNMASISSISHLINTSGFRTNTSSGSMEYSLIIKGSIMFNEVFFCNFGRRGDRTSWVGNIPCWPLCR